MSSLYASKLASKIQSESSMISVLHVSLCLTKEVALGQLTNDTVQHTGLLPKATWLMTDYLNNTQCLLTKYQNQST